MSAKIVLATRGSALALWQARTARDLLVAAVPAREVEILVVESSGDRSQHLDLADLGGIGVFTAEVDAAVVEGRADAAVHSLKDMTTTLPEGIALASVLARGPAEDVLVSREGGKLVDLPRGARVATGSVRRIAMLKRMRPDLEVVAIRGNVDTRLARLEGGAADALVMAHAGLARLGLARSISEVFDVGRFVPAVGQGIVGLTCRRGDAETARALEAIGDPEAWAEALAERSLLHALHGGCNAPIGGHARSVDDHLVIHACVLSLDGKESIEASLAGPADEAAGIGHELAERLAARGARALVEAARRR